jgi:hypothetical protein
MKRFRVIIMAATAGIALALPWSEPGALGIQILAPILLGIFTTWFYAEWSVRARAILLLSVVGGVALSRICWEAVVLDGGDWSFDGERTLVAVSVVIQFVFAAVAFIGTWFALQRRQDAGVALAMEGSHKGQAHSVGDFSTERRLPRSAVLNL